MVNDLRIRLANIRGGIYNWRMETQSEGRPSLIKSQMSLKFMMKSVHEEGQVILIELNAIKSP